MAVCTPLVLVMDYELTGMAGTGREAVMVK
jgi:hypothetical protein